MTNYEVVEFENVDGKTQHIIIDNGDGSFTSMPKAVWDELEAKRESGQII